MKFYPLKVQSVVKETPSAVSLIFEIPSELKDIFSYRPGQYLTIKASINGEEIRRAYSINTSPYVDKNISVTVKKVEGGKMSSFLTEFVRENDILEVMPPKGNFIPDLEGDYPAVYFGIAAGSGITPIISILRSVLVKTSSRFVLVYGNKNQDETIFREKIQELEQQYPGRFKTYFVFSREKNTLSWLEGRIDAEKISRIMKEEGIHPASCKVFICGPAMMIQSLTDYFYQQNFPKSSVRYELFTAAPKEQKKLPLSESEEDAPEKSRVTIILDDKSTTITMDRNGLSILDAAMEAGLDVPYSCKGAVCCTCKAKVLSGKARMDQNYALTEAEVEQGFILTCQAHPLTGEVTVSYDDLF